MQTPLSRSYLTICFCSTFWKHGASRPNLLDHLMDLISINKICPAMVDLWSSTGTGKILSPDYLHTSLSGWVGVLNTLRVYSTWLLKKAQLPIIIVDLRTTRFSLLHWTYLQYCRVTLPEYIQTINLSTTVVWSPYHYSVGWCHRSGTVQREAELILTWAELHVPYLTTAHYRHENWQRRLSLSSIFRPPRMFCSAGSVFKLSVTC